MRSDVYISSVLAKADGLARAGMWTQKVRPKAWINNFDQDDRVIAAFLLDQFCFCSEAITERILAAAFDAMAHGPRHGASVMASEDLASAVVAPVEGEDPNVTDSGNLMCRMARQIMTIDENRIVSPEDACDFAARGVPVILVDDFVGSGEQLIEMLSRDYGRFPKLIESISAGTRVYALAAVATRYGSQRIRSLPTPISLFVGHELDDSYCMNSDMFRASATDPALAAMINPLLDKYAPRLKPTQAHMQKPAALKYGFHSQCLAFAFSHSVPDATMPLFWAPGPDETWTPLVERL